MFPEGRFLEFLLAAIVALVVVGPKDLPVLLRRLGRAVGKVRAMAAEFRASFDEMARQSELDELRKEVEAMRRGQLADIAAHSGEAEMRSMAGEIGEGLSGVQMHPPMSYQFSEMQPPPPEAATPAEPPPAVKPARKPRAAKPSLSRAKPAVSKTKAKPAAATKSVAAKAKVPAKPGTRRAARKTTEAGS